MGSCYDVREGVKAGAEEIKLFREKEEELEEKGDKKEGGRSSVLQRTMCTLK